jgi:hypothetical protein
MILLQNIHKFWCENPTKTKKTNPNTISIFVGKSWKFHSTLCFGYAIYLRLGIGAYFA